MYIGKSRTPYLLEYVKSILNTIKVCQEYLKHNFSTLAYKNRNHNSIKHMGMPGMLEYVRDFFLAQGMPGIPLA